jgi:hypothetical protein
MQTFFRRWLAALNETERNLRSQGYIVVYGGMTSLVVPLTSGDRSPGNRGKLLWLWGAAPTAIGL